MRNTRNGQKQWFSLFRTNVAFWMAAGILAPFLSAHYKSIGLSSTQIGILFAVSPICAICIQPIWAYISDKTGKRRMVLGLLSVGTAFAALLHYTGNSFPVCFMATVAMALFSSALLPLCDAIVIDLADKFRCNFATIRIGGTLGYALVVILVGVIVERWPGIHFGLAAGGYLVFALAVWGIPAQEYAGTKNPAEKRGNARGEQGIFVSREVVFVLLFAFVMSLGLGFCGSFTGVYAVELGYSSRFIGMLSCISALSEVPILLYARKLTNRFGEMTILQLSAVLISLRLLLIGHGQTATMILGQLLQGVTYMTTYYCCTRYISAHVKAGKISQGQSVLTLVQSGLASVSGNLAGGWVMDQLGARNAYNVMAMAVLTVSVLVMAAYRVYTKNNHNRRQVVQ